MSFGLIRHLAMRWLVIAVAPALVVALLVFFFVRQQPKIYEASTLLYVQQPSQNGAVGSTDVSQSEAVIPTYTEMISSSIIAASVDQQLGSRYPGYRLADHSPIIGVAGSASASQPNTQLIQITVKDTLAPRAAVASDAVARAFIKQIRAAEGSHFKTAEHVLQRQLNTAQANIQNVSQAIARYTGPPGGLDNLKSRLTAYQGLYQSLLSDHQQFLINRDTAVSSVRMFSPARTPTSPVAPRPTQMALLFGLVALLLCIGGMFAYDYFDDSLQRPEEVEEITGAPLLGTVQEFDPSGGDSELVTAHARRSPVAEAYRLIRTNLQFTRQDDDSGCGPRVVVVTSSTPMEGKSTTASNLANVFAEGGERVTLIDADLRRPTLHRIFGVDREDGLSNMLGDTAEVNGHHFQGTQEQNLRILASGPIPPRPSDLLNSGRMATLIKNLRDESQMVVVDSPPILPVADAALLASLSDGVVLVVDPKKSKRRELRRAREMVEAAGSRVLGVVINRLSERRSGYYYHSYQQNYGYEYKYDYSQRGKR